MNDPQLFRLIRRVTGCRRIGCFTGRIYRMVARRGVELNWHDDNTVDDVKLVSLSVRSLSAIIARDYGAPHRDVERDVLALAHRIVERDLIEIVRAAS